MFSDKGDDGKEGVEVEGDLAALMPEVVLVNGVDNDVC